MAEQKLSDQQDGYISYNDVYRMIDEQAKPFSQNSDYDYRKLFDDNSDNGDGELENYLLKVNLHKPLLKFIEKLATLDNKGDIIGIHSHKLRMKVQLIISV